MEKLLVKPLQEIVSERGASEIEVCCDSPSFLERNGFLVCSNCGAIKSEIIDFSPLVNYSMDQRNNRTINEKVYSPIGPRTKFLDRRDANGNYLSPNQIARFERLQKINNSLTNGFERNLWIALPEFKHLATLLNISDFVIEDAKTMYRYAVRKKLVLGRRIEDLVAATIYCALRVNRIPVTMEELIKQYPISKKNLVKNYKMVVLKILPALKMQVKRITCSDYFVRFADKLNLGMELKAKGLATLKNALTKGLKTSGKDPKGIAAAIIYMLTKETDGYLTQKEICELTKITETTLRIRIKEISKLCLLAHS